MSGYILGNPVGAGIVGGLVGGYVAFSRWNLLVPCQYIVRCKPLVNHFFKDNRGPAAVLRGIKTASVFMKVMGAASIAVGLAAVGSVAAAPERIDVLRICGGLLGSWAGSCFIHGGNALLEIGGEVFQERAPVQQRQRIAMGPRGSYTPARAINARQVRVQ